MALQEQEENKIQTHGAKAQCCLSFNICTWAKTGCFVGRESSHYNCPCIIRCERSRLKAEWARVVKRCRPSTAQALGALPVGLSPSLREHTAPEYMLQRPHVTGSVAHSHPTLTHQHTLQVGRGKFCSLHCCGAFSRKRNKKMGDGGYLKTNWLPNLIFVYRTAWLSLTRETLRQASQALWANLNQGVRFDGHVRLPV